MYMHGPACPHLVGLIFLAEEKRFSGSTASIETICPILAIYMIVTACSWWHGRRLINIPSTGRGRFTCTPLSMSIHQLSRSTDRPTGYIVPCTGIHEWRYRHVRLPMASTHGDARILDYSFEWWWKERARPRRNLERSGPSAPPVHGHFGPMPIVLL
jgi:hypothetical protein